MNVFIDANVLLDVLLEREPFVVDSRKVWYLSEQRKLRGLVSTLSFANIYYVVNKLKGPSFAMSMMGMLRECFNPVAFDEQVLNRSIDGGLKDFEDAVQYFSALRAKAECLVTRNREHFPGNPLPVLTPAEFLAAYQFA